MSVVVGKDILYNYTDEATGKILHIPICKYYE